MANQDTKREPAIVRALHRTIILILASMVCVLIGGFSGLIPVILFGAVLIIVGAVQLAVCYVWHCITARKVNREEKEQW